MYTRAPRCAHTPLLPYLYTYIYLWNYIYLSWLALHVPGLHGGELTPHSTNTLQGYFPRSLRLSFIISCTQNSLQLWVTWIRRGNWIWMHMDAGHFPQGPAHMPSTALPGVQKGCCKQQPWFGPVTWIFQPKTRVYHSGWGGTSLQPTKSSPRGCCCQNRPCTKINHN